jgi:hypothetical protein
MVLLVHYIHNNDIYYGFAKSKHYEIPINIIPNWNNLSNSELLHRFENRYKYDLDIDEINFINKIYNDLPNTKIIRLYLE